MSDLKVSLLDASTGEEYLALLPAVPRKGENVVIDYPATGEHNWYVKQVKWVSTEVAGHAVSKVVCLVDDDLGSTK